MNILVTGATGYIGWELCKRLVTQGHMVKALCRQIPMQTDWSGLTWVQGNIENKNDILHAMEGCEEVYHTAAFARMTARDASRFYKTNVDGTQHVLEAAAYHGVKRLVHTSSAGVLGKSLLVPLTEDDARLEPFNNDYDLSKHLAEQKVIAYVKNGNDAVIVNPSRVFGPGNSTYANVVTRTIQNYLRYSYYLVPGNGEAIGNYAFIDDVINGHLLAMQKGKAGQRYILGGTNISFNNLFALLNEITSLKRRRLALPMPVIVAFAYAQQAWKWMQRADAELTPELARRLSNHRMLSDEKAMIELGYTHTDLEQGLRMTLRFLGFPKTSNPLAQTEVINPTVKYSSSILL